MQSTCDDHLQHISERFAKEEVNLERAARSRPDNERGVMSPTDTLVRIEQGELLCGIFDNRTVGSSGGSLIHVIWNECGPEVCKDFLKKHSTL